jgi:tetratricopeptide (TPR) repeat protein
MPMGDGLGRPDAAEVRAALDELLAWEAMRRSPQLAAFLNYIVEATLRGEASGLKAYSIAVDVLGRGEDFDPQRDPIVRVQARRLRSLMSTFYASGYSSSRVQIELPVGRYVPEFKPRGEGWSEPERRAENSETAPRNVWIVGLIALSVLVAAIVFWPSLSERTGSFSAVQQPVMPLVIIEEFENLAYDEQGAPLVAGLAVELVTDFNQFPNVLARYGGAQAALSPAEIALQTPVYLLSGVARRVATGIQYGVVLKDGVSGAAIFDLDVTVPLVDGHPEMSIDDVSRYFVMRLGSPRSVLHAPARSWLAENAEVRPDLYPCLVAYSIFLEQMSDKTLARAQACAERLAGSHIDAQAVLASILADIAWARGVETAEGKEALARSRQLATSARDAAPTSSLAWMVLGRVAYFSGSLQEARDNFNSAYQLNPAEPDTVAGYAQVLASLGNWPAAMNLSADVRAAEAEPPAWYNLVPALHALRTRDYPEAIDFATLALPGYPELSVAILVSAGASSGNTQVVNAYLPRLLAGQGYRRMGILPTLRYLISDTELLRQLSNGMSMAGVPLDRLARPF